MELEHRNKVERDYIVPVQGMKLGRDGRMFLMGTQTPFAAIPLFYRQLASALSISMRHYDLIQKKKPELLAENVNAWLGACQNNYMIHSMDYGAGPVTRALLSKRYGRIDNMEIALAVLSLFARNDGYSVESYEVTEHRLCLKILDGRLEMKVRRGGIVQAGIMISNPGVGLGVVSVQPLVYKLVCLSGLIVSSYGKRRSHVDRQTKMMEDFTLYLDETLQAENKAFLPKLRNTIMAVIEKNRFTQVVDRLKEAAGAPIKDNVQEAVELTDRELGITQKEQNDILRYLVEDGDLPLYGFTNAVTRMSQGVDSYGRATALEWVGWQVMQRRELYVQEERSQEDKESAMLRQTGEYQ